MQLRERLSGGLWCSTNMKACGEDSAQTKLKVHMGSLCKFIRVGESFYQFTSFKVGNDFFFKFWHISWYDGQPLQERFSNLFSIARDKDAVVVVF